MFTTSTETVTLSSVTTTFTCEQCEHTAGTREDMVRHFGDKHAVRAKTAISDDDEDLKLSFLENEESYKAWTAHLSWGSRVQSFKWHGPGWYAVEQWTQPCPRGCCDDDCVGTEFLERLVARRSDELREKTLVLHELKKLISEAP